MQHGQATVASGKIDKGVGIGLRRDQRSAATGRIYVKMPFIGFVHEASAGIVLAIDPSLDASKAVVTSVRLLWHIEDAQVVR